MSLKRASVLVVDDDIRMLRMMQHTRELEGYQCDNWLRMSYRPFWKIKTRRWSRGYYNSKISPEPGSDTLISPKLQY